MIFPRSVNKSAPLLTPLNDFSALFHLTQLPVLHIHTNVTQQEMLPLLVPHSLSAHNNNSYGGFCFSFVNIYIYRFTDAGTEASRSVPCPDLHWNWEERLFPSLLALLGFPASFFYAA